MRVIIIYCHGPLYSHADTSASYASLHHAIPGVGVQHPVHEPAPAASMLCSVPPCLYNSRQDFSVEQGTMEQVFPCRMGKEPTQASNHTPNNRSL